MFYYDIQDFFFFFFNFELTQWRVLLFDIQDLEMN